MATWKQRYGKVHVGTPVGRLLVSAKEGKPRKAPFPERTATGTMYLKDDTLYF